MPDSATPDQSATVTRPRQSPNGIAPPLPGETTRTRQPPPGRLRMALTQLREMMRRTVRRP
jgi:hypothetical protein